MASPVSDDIACFDSLPDDLVGVIMGKLNLGDAVRLTQACPTARRLVQGERAVPGVLGKVYVGLPEDFNNREQTVAIFPAGFQVHEVKATTDEEEDAERQPSACIVYMLEWIRVRAGAFTEIVFFASTNREVLDHIADSFLPNVPSSYRGKISFQFTWDETELVQEEELEQITNFLAAWRALAPAYECGLTIGGGLTIEWDELSSELLLPPVQAAPPLSSLRIEAGVGGSSGLKKFLDSLDTSRITKLHAPKLVLASLPSQDVLPPKLHDLSLCIDPRCWRNIDAFLAPVHRLTDLELLVGYGDSEIDSSLTLAPFTVLPKLRLLKIVSWSTFLSPPEESDYWKEHVVLPALEELYLDFFNDPEPQGEGEEPAASQPSRWPTLLSNLEAPKLERLRYTFSARSSDYDRTPDLPLGQFPRLHKFDVSVPAKTPLDLPALRAEIATLRHLERPRAHEVPILFSRIRFYAKDPVPEEDVKAWELELGFKMDIERTATEDADADDNAHMRVELTMCRSEF